MSKRALVPLLCVLLAGPVVAADAEWKLGEEKLRYDHKPEAAPSGATPLTVAAHHLLGQADFPDARRPRLGVAGHADLVWHYALRVPRLPVGVKRRRGRPVTLQVDESFPLRKGALKVTGNRSVRIKGRRWQVRSSLLIAGPKDVPFKKGNLVVNSVFDSKGGRLERATYVFEVTASAPDGKSVRTDTWQGAVQPARAVRVIGKDFHAEVQKAIQRGSEWLEKATAQRLATYRSARKPAHQALGRMALPCFALLRSGVPPERLQNHFVWCAKQPFRATYSVALWVMALEARSIKRSALPPRNRTRSVTRFERGQLPAPDKELMRRAIEWLIKTRGVGAGWWSYFGTPPGSDAGGKGGPVGHDGKTPAKVGDRSNSQFAVLALHSALASGVEVPDAVWSEIVAEAFKSQAKKGPKGSLEGSVFTPESPFAFDPRDERGDPNKVSGTRERGAKKVDPTLEERRDTARGWSYVMTRRPKGGAYGSMSAAGVSTLAISLEGLRRAGKLSPKLERKLLGSLRDGLCWLLANYDPGRNPKRDGTTWYYYWLYSLEKAMDTSGVDRLGVNEWWRDVAAELLVRQGVKGDWGSLEDTSFALLVLNRATLPAKLEITDAERRKTGREDPSFWDRVVVEGVGQLRLRALLAAMAETPDAAAERLELAQKATLVLDPADLPRLVPELVALRSHRHKATRKWARKTLRACAGTDDSKLLAGFVQRWQAVRLIGEAMDYGRLPELGRVVRDATAPLPLVEQALLVAGRLRALELVEDTLAALNVKDGARRQAIWAHLVTLCEGAPDFDPQASPRQRAEELAAWRTWWKGVGPLQLQAEHVRRWVADLSYPGRTKSAERHLVGAGRVALRPLVDALRSEVTRKKAHRLLLAITGAKAKPTLASWQAWVEAEEKRAREKKKKKKQ
jgi:hypothetical protein